LGDPAKAKIYPMFSDRRKFAEELKEKFPKDKEAVDKFMAILKVSNSRNFAIFITLQLKFSGQYM